MRTLLALTVLSVGVMTPDSVPAIGLSEISQQSALGEPLRLVIPVIVNDQLSGEDVAGECFKVVSATVNDIPQVNNARLTLERKGAQAFVVLTTVYPIEEPIMRVAVQAGCRVSISREYTVLFDPVSIQSPAVQVAAATAQEARSVERVADAPAEAPAPVVEAAPPELHPVQRSQTPRERAATAPRSKPRLQQRATTNIASRPSLATATAPAAPRAPKPSSAPRLQISRTIGDASAEPATMKPKSVADQEALMALEEQTVVLQRQVAELAAQMAQIDAELQAAQAARAAAEKKVALAATASAAAKNLASRTAWSAVRDWLAENWVSLLVVPVLIGLIVALARERRGQRPLIPRPFTAMQAESFNAADLGEPSVPNPKAERDTEGVVASIKDRPRAHMIPPAFVDPIEPDKPAKAAQSQTHYEYDPGISVADNQVEDVYFDEEVRKAYELASEYSVLEREEPGIVARLVDGWGTQRTTAQLESILLTPRRSGKPLSHGAMEELKLLRSIAMERVTDLDSTIRPWIGNSRTPSGPVAGTH